MYSQLVQDILGSEKMEELAEIAQRSRHVTLDELRGTMAVAKVHKTFTLNFLASQLGICKDRARRICHTLEQNNQIKLRSSNGGGNHYILVCPREII